VQRVADMIGEIAAATIEQSQGISQVNNAVTMMDEATQQNAALVEQAAAAAESLVEQANALSSAISVFQLDTGAKAATRVTATQAPTRAKPRLVSTQPNAQPVMLLAKNGSNDGDWLAY